ncbi:similar to cullin 3 [Betaentomopoxvirus amoorei]|uniref:AMV236 n=1 Tax=Amsacta moorei entomopoxvirus TaxID=28321 RepID=Q9EMH0_AMEPV|nr:similar to cullin 3 [Amsacta moorei entomopoxvirus]AAG02942.1 AMV236 [Amsacta moorei entomopoxvirus]
MIIDINNIYNNIYNNILYYLNIIYRNVIFPFKKYIFLNYSIEIINLLSEDEMFTLYANLYKFIKNDNFVDIIKKIKKIIDLSQNIIINKTTNDAINNIYNKINENESDQIDSILNISQEIINEFKNIYINIKNDENVNNINILIDDLSYYLQNIINDENFINVKNEIYKIHNNKNKTIIKIREHIDNNVIFKLLFVFTENLLNLYLKINN